MIIGFTGSSRLGMSPKQRSAFENRLIRVLFGTRGEFHHGDCIRCDAEAHKIARSLGIPIFIHPPIDPKKRAFCLGGTLLPVKEYLERNQDIVDCCDRLIATPMHMYEESRSGTWSTIRYALRLQKPVAIVWRDGTVEDR